MYIVFFRSAPYPLFGTFDVPDFQTTCTRRARSNTPLQALNISNDPAFMDFAQGLALRTIQTIPGEAHTTLDQRIRLAFKLALSRSPNDREFETLKNYAIEFAKDISAKADGEDAKSLINEAIIESEIPLNQGAALVAVSRAILNTDNFITRE